MKKTVYDVIFYLAVFMALQIVQSQLTGVVAPLLELRATIRWLL